MKTITIKQPWAQLIVDGIKDIENRTWPTKFRGRVLIHASKHIPFKQIESLVKERGIPCWQEETYPEGAIIGSVEIVDCVINHKSIWAEKTDEENLIAPIIYNWVLANPILFPEPIPAKGKLSFWDYQNILAEPEEKDGPLFCHCQLPVKEENQVTGDSRFGFYCRYCGGKWYK